MSFKDNCTKSTANKKIILRENRSVITFQNKEENEVVVVEVDGCEINDNGVKCDYLLLDNNKDEHFIELKGQNIKHAIKQLSRSIEKLSSDVKNGKKLCFIITTRSPLSAASIQVLRVKFRKKYNSDLIVKNSPCVYKL